MASTTARQRILALIGRKNGVTAAQVGRALNLSAATVRHHLSILAADGRVIVQGAVQGRRGRPEKSYRLSDRVIGENLGTLADAVLTSWLEGATDADRAAALEAVARRLTQQLGAIPAEQPAAKRIVQLIEQLNGMRYQARWEAGAEGPRILFGHCPYAAIIDAHPELCTMDALMLKTATNADVQQLSKIDRRPGGVNQCAFATQFPTAKAGG